MTEGDAAAGAVRETTVFLSYFEALPDYRAANALPTARNIP